MKGYLMSFYMWGRKVFLGYFRYGSVLKGAALIGSVCLILLGSVHRGWAKPQDVPGIVQSLIAHGERFYDQGQFKEAMDDFSRVLILDPFHQKAKAYLMKMNVNHVEGDIQYKVDLVHFQDLMSRYEQLRERLVYMKQQYASFQTRLSSKGFVHPLINEDPFDEWARYLSKSDDEQSRFKISSSIEYPLKVVNEHLIHQRRRLEQQLGWIQERFVALRNLHTPYHALDDRRQIAWAQGDTNQQPIKSWDDDRVRVSSSFAKGRQEFVSSGLSTQNMPVYQEARQDRSLLKDDLMVLRNEMEAIKDTLIVRDAKVVSLTEQVVALSLEIQEKEQVLEKKMQQTIVLNNEMHEMKERFKLSQHMMQEKDGRVKELMDKLQDFQMAFSQQRSLLMQKAMSTHHEVQEFRDVLAIYQDKLQDTTKHVKEKAAHIHTLEDQLMLAQREIFTKDQDLQQTKKDLSSLQEQLYALQKRLSEFQDNVEQSSSIQQGEDFDMESLQTQLLEVHQFLMQRLMHLDDKDKDIAVGDIRAIDHILKSSQYSTGLK